MKEKTLRDILNGKLEENEEQNEEQNEDQYESNSDKVKFFVESLENKEIMKIEAKKASKIAFELSENYENGKSKI